MHEKLYSLLQHWLSCTCCCNLSLYPLKVVDDSDGSDFEAESRFVHHHTFYKFTLRIGLITFVMLY